MPSVCSFRAHVTPRFVRHFNVIGYVDMSDDDKRVIFSTILDNFLSTGFENSLARCQKKQGRTELRQSCLLCKCSGLRSRRSMLLESLFPIWRMRPYGLPCIVDHCLAIDGQSRLVSSLSPRCSVRLIPLATRLSSAVVDATIEVFNTITRELLPTPQKSHYTFNLRDMAKVFQGGNRFRTCTCVIPEKGGSLSTTVVPCCSAMFLAYSVSEKEHITFFLLTRRADI